MDARAGELGGPAEESGASAQRAEARAGLSQARQNRDEAQAKRTIAAVDRDESRKRRQADASPTRLAMVFADTQGHIGLKLTGRIPIRNVQTRGYRPGDDPDHQWDGLIPFEDMPGVIDPARGFAATFSP